MEKKNLIAQVYLQDLLTLKNNTMKKNITQRVDISQIKKLRNEFAETGILVFPEFLDKQEVEKLQREARELYSSAYKSSTAYNLFVEDKDKIESDFLRNTQFNTQKSCICYDQISEKSLLKELYASSDFQDFVCSIL
jgi:hypothetical protein